MTRSTVASSDAVPAPTRVALVDLWADPGTRNYTAPLAESLASRPDITLLLYLNKNTVFSLYRKALAESTSRLFAAPTGYKPISALFMQPFGILKLLFCLLRDKPDIIHFTFMHPWVTLLLPLLRMLFPIAITWHDLNVHEGEEVLRHKLARRALMKYATVLFVHSEKHRQTAVSELGMDPERLVVVPHGTYEHWRSGDEPGGEEPATFLFFGRIFPYKAPDVLFKAFARLMERHPEARLIVAGSGDLSQYDGLIACIDSNLELHNRTIPEEEAVKFFERATAVVMCHREVTQSGILFAAASIEKPVIASRVGALEETIKSRETGLLVPREDVEALASAMAWMIEHPAERRKMGLALREYVTGTHGPGVVAEITSAGYRWAIKKRSREQTG